MNTVMIVDDEYLIREGIKKNIDWDELNLYLIGEAENGLNAIYMIEQQVPDILILDICMPMMDGLELAKAVKQRYPNTNIIMATGYDEFNFVHEALTIGVEDYILKPITKEKINETLAKINEKRASEENKILQSNTVNKVLLEKNIYRVLNGSEENIEIEAFPLSFDPDAELFCVGFITIKEILGECWAKAMNKSDLINFSILNITNEILLSKRMGFVMLADDGEIVVLFSVEQEDDKLENIREIVSEIMESIESYIKIQIAVSVGRAVDNLSDIKTSYQTAKTATDFQLLDAEMDVVIYDDIKELQYTSMVYPHHLEKGLFDSLLSEEDGVSSKSLSDYFEYIRINNFKISDIRSALLILVSSVLRFVSDYDILIGDLCDENCNILNSLNNQTNVKDMFETTKDFVLKAKLTLKKYKSRPKQLADKITEYIKENYQNPELNLNMMAKNLYISTSYISAIFKNDIGKSFVDFLTEIRLEKAKQLLIASQNKTYEVGEMVGYRTPQYFSTIFKKETGCSPSEYRKKFGNG